jgi:hypothetical protein
MEATEVLGRNQLFSAMNGGKPFMSYKKTILAQAAVTLWDAFTESPTQVIIKGDPRRDVESCIIDVWGEKEKVFFERMNRKHFQAGVLIPFERKVEEVEVEKSIEQYSDEELSVIVNSKFLALSATLNKIESTAVLFRIKNLAEDAEKSDKIIRAIESRISEIQVSEFQPKASEAEED